MSDPGTIEDYKKGKRQKTRKKIAFFGHFDFE